MAGLHAAIGILAALRHRDRTGEGQLVEVDLLSTTLFSLANQASGYLTAGVVPGRMGNRHPSIAPYETLSTADSQIVVAVGNDAQFATFAGVIGRAELAEDERFATNAGRVTDREALVSELEGALAGAGAADWVRKLGEAGIPSGLVNDVAQAFEFARHAGLDPVATLRRDDGSEVATTANPIRLSATPASYRLAPPRLGEQTEEVLSQLRVGRPDGEGAEDDY
jgi:crotonobetainyl-CoA:carnitine CoA-transferase CaiB-like acyl-CoA transferase